LPLIGYFEGLDAERASAWRCRFLGVAGGAAGSFDDFPHAVA